MYLCLFLRCGEDQGQHAIHRLWVHLRLVQHPRQRHQSASVRLFDLAALAAMQFPGDLLQLRSELQVLNPGDGHDRPLGARKSLLRLLSVFATHGDGVYMKLGVISAHSASLYSTKASLASSWP